VPAAARTPPLHHSPGHQQHLRSRESRQGLLSRQSCRVEGGRGVDAGTMAQWRADEAPFEHQPRRGLSSCRRSVAQPRQLTQAGQKRTSNHRLRGFSRARESFVRGGSFVFGRFPRGVLSARGQRAENSKSPGGFCENRKVFRHAKMNGRRLLWGVVRDRYRWRFPWR
jgi:hypothetical protein